MKRIAVIGGGAAGLVAAIAAARNCADAQVRVYEMDERVGRRILATGNGRCNFSNADMRADLYNDPATVSRVFEQCPPDEVLEFFAELGLAWTEEAGGRLLPATGKASTVVDVLRGAMADLGVEEMCGTAVAGLVAPRSEGDPWTLCMADGRFERAEAVVVCGGGQDVLGFLPSEVPCKPLRGVLGPLKTETALIRGLDNIRVKCAVSLLRSGVELAAEAGELLFRKYGVSGICVFNLSRFAEVGDVVRVNLRPGMAEADLVRELAARAEVLLQRRSRATVKDLFCGMLLPQVADMVLANAGVASGALLTGCSRGDLSRLAAGMQRIDLRVEGPGDLAQCQVHRGGVDPASVDERLQSKALAGLFFAGEILDVDGPCGGYNLHWAWASGMVAGKAAAEKVGECR